MRKLVLKDAFAVARIVKAAGVKKEIVAFAKDVQNRKEGINPESIGLEFFATLIESAADASVERKIYDFYASLKGVTAEEVSEYDLATVKADIKEIVEQNDLKNFFQSASALMSA